MLEAHLTIRRELEPAFCEWLEETGLKLTHLSLGESGVELMVSARWRSSYEEALARVHGLAAELRVRGASVERIKLEGELDAEGGRYLEHHVKIRYPLAAREALRAIARVSKLHFSSTAQHEADGEEERFLTRRFPIDARAEEDSALRALIAVLPATGARILKIERERVLYDDAEGAR